MARQGEGGRGARPSKVELSRWTGGPLDTKGMQTRNLPSNWLITFADERPSNGPCQLCCFLFAILRGGKECGTGPFGLVAKRPTELRMQAEKTRDLYRPLSLSPSPTQ